MPLCELDFRPMSMFKGRTCDYTAKRWGKGFPYVVSKLLAELDRSEIADAILETDHTREQYTMSGRPRSGEEPRTPRVQLWFELNGSPVCFPSSHFMDWVENIHAIAMTLERQRLIRDYGVVSIEEQFSAFAQLPAGGAELAVTGDLNACAMFVIERSGKTITVAKLLENPETFHEHYKLAAARTHPDRGLGGSEELMSALNRARDTIRASKGW